MPELSIQAWGAAGGDVDGVHKAMFGRAFRRVGRFVKLAQVGAARCLEGIEDRDGIGVFLGSGLGNITALVPLAHGVLHPTRPRSSPLTFAGSLGNSASFFVAQVLGSTGLNQTVSQEELTFEAALLQASLALRAGRVRRALVGGVDVVVGEEAEQRARLGAQGVPGRLAEGAAFVLLGLEPRARVRLDDVWLGHGDPLAGVSAPGTVLPGWRCEPRAGQGPREERLCPVATGLRLVDLLRGDEVVDSQVVTLTQRDARGQGGRVRVVRR